MNALDLFKGKEPEQKMIIFDLDGTLADCSHRRHFVDPLAPRPGGEDYALSLYSPYLNMEFYHKYANGKRGFFYHDTHKRWVPDWQSFYDACDKDTPITQTLNLAGLLSEKGYYAANQDVHIWSGRCESVRKKTEEWLKPHFIYYNELKMRPIGDSTPDDELKELWLDEVLAQGKKIDFVVDDRAKVVRMWRRRGIFVFDVNQSGKEF